MSSATIESGAICAALRAFAEGALGLAAALEGAQPVVDEGPDLSEVWAIYPAPDTEEPSPDVAPVAESSYRTGHPLTERGEQVRADAADSARGSGYDFEHWCGMVRELRVGQLGTSVRLFAAMLEVSVSCVHSWEAGMAFAKGRNLAKLENLAAGAAGWERKHWRTEKGD